MSGVVVRRRPERDKTETRMDEVRKAVDAFRESGVYGSIELVFKGGVLKRIRETRQRELDAEGI